MIFAEIIGIDLLLSKQRKNTFNYGLYNGTKFHFFSGQSNMYAGCLATWKSGKTQGK